MMMKCKHRFAYFLCLMVMLAVPARAAQPGECRTLREVSAEYQGPPEYDQGLLWRVSKPGAAPSYLFGTIHVADEDIVNLPTPVRNALKSSSTFAMEVLPDPTQIVLFSKLMFFADGTRLKDLLSPPLYRRTIKILDAYNLSDEAVERIKPWAAFMTMSYPPDFRKVLDLQLLEAAEEHGSDVHGLETLEEEGNILNNLKMNEQVRLLTDTVCNYDVMSAEIEKIKSMYLKRDLKGLYMIAQRHSFGDDALYDKLTRLLLTNRNRTMVSRMKPLIDDGNAFIAIGAMHLAGRKGVLSLLARDKYTISRVY